jgi:TIR domain
MSCDLFISHSTRDKTAADAACAALESAGIRCWIAPRDITPGVEWGEAIIDAISQCRVMVLIFSANANESSQIRREVERAVSKAIPIIPLRIEDIVPVHSLAYFIGNVHWLDAMTPPLDAHLGRLVESVKALLQIAPVPPTLPPPATQTPIAQQLTNRTPYFVLIAVVFVAAAAAWAWWLVGARAPPPHASSAAALATQPFSAHATATGASDGNLSGTLEHAAVVDDYNWRFVWEFTANGTYRLIITQEEEGTFQGHNGRYRTVASKTGRVREGTYRAVGNSAIEVRSASGAVIFRPVQHDASFNPTDPIMLGVWTANTIENGETWTMSISNHPDGTYHYQGRAEDDGTYTLVNQQLRTTSAVTGKTEVSTVRRIDARAVEITGRAGPTIWQRR